MTIEQFDTMEGYTFDEGVAFLVLCNDAPGVIRHLTKTHNRPELHARIHKLIRIPSISRMLREKGFYKPSAAEPIPVVHVPEPAVPVPKQPENVRIADENVRIADENADEDNGETEIILTIEDVRSHKYTRLEDMPNDLMRTLWLKRQDVYRQMQQAHLKMRNVPEGEEHDEERAYWRAEVLRLDAENDSYWLQIDDEMKRFMSQVVDSRPKNTLGFDVSTYRAYISKALRKKQLTPAQLAELQHRVDALMAAKVEIKPETLDKLKAVGIDIG